jgi:hypothetical protein
MRCGSTQIISKRNPDGAQRTPGSGRKACTTELDFASLNLGYLLLADKAQKAPVAVGNRGLVCT